MAFNSIKDEVYEPISEINVTPFVDVLLVLLVIFMVTAPLFKSKAIDVQLPKENLRSSAVKDARRMIISVNQNGTYFIRGKRYTSNQLLQELTKWSEKKNGETVFIRADRRVRYEKITKLMVFLKNNGFFSLGLLVEDKV